MTTCTVGVISWDGRGPAAASIASAACSIVSDVIVIYSNLEGAEEIGSGRWIKVPQEHFFGKKFKKLIEVAAEDQNLLLIQADAECDDWPSLIRRYCQVAQKWPDLGLWAPAVDHTPFQDELVAVRCMPDGLLEVLQTDGIVLGFDRTVTARLRELDFEANNLGWGIDWAAIGYCRTQQRRVFRDLFHLVRHPPSSGYDGALARGQMIEYLRQLDVDEAEAVRVAEATISERKLSPNRSSKLLSSAFRSPAPMTPLDLADAGELLEAAPFVVVQPGRVSLTLRNPSAPVSVRLGDKAAPSQTPAPDAPAPRLLAFASAGPADIGRTVTDGADSPCPGQSTLRLSLQPHHTATQIALTDLVVLGREYGDIRVWFTAAARRATVDIVVESVNLFDADDRHEIVRAIDRASSAEGGARGFEVVDVPLPAIDGTRLITLSVRVRGVDPGGDEAALFFCTRPVLLPARDLSDATTPVVFSADTYDDLAPNLEFTFDPVDIGLELAVGDRRYLLASAPEGRVRLFDDGGELRAAAQTPCAVTVYVNGRAVRTSWLGPAPRPLVIDGRPLRVDDARIELRDLTGNIILAAATVDPAPMPASFNAAVEVIAASPIQPVQITGARHPDAMAIEHSLDRDFYLSSFAPEDRPSDAASHYLFEGWRQGRDPAPWFSTRHYLAMHPDVAEAGINPFLHYCTTGVGEGRKLVTLGRPADGGLVDAHAFAVSPGPHFEEFDPRIGAGRQKRAKVLAYYLPQYHAVDVNDRQWGKGFTEWRNLPRGLPRFDGHVQPRIPRDLGCYDLAESDVMRSQIQLARESGVHGFCFYHYWFDGKRVLERPMERMLVDSSLDFPFCLMWANENWTRTWDGSEKEIILAQSYRLEDDGPFIDDVARHMIDPRYIRIANRPLFFIYRPGHIPDAVSRLGQWRVVFREKYGLDPLIFSAQAFGDNDPRVFALDGAIEFPPHKVLGEAPDITSGIALFDTRFSGNIRDYDAIANVAIAEPPPDFPLIRTVFPSWDNEARRPGRSTIVANSTPAKFERWLNAAVEFAEENDVYGDRFVCINAWNEWAEGAYLEPDVHFGAAYLNALSRVIHRAAARGAVGERLKVLLVGHDVLAFGAQMLVTRIGRVLSAQFGAEVAFLILDGNTHGGAFPTTTAQMREIGPVTFADSFPGDGAAIAAMFKSKGFHSAIANTTVSGQFVPFLKAAGISTVSLIHELPRLLKSYHLEEAASRIARHSDVVIFPAEVVRSGFEQISGPVTGAVEIRPQGLYDTRILQLTAGDHGVRGELELLPTTKIVLGAGYADLRKGIDRFVSTGVEVCAAHPDIAFIWAGPPAGDIIGGVQAQIDAAGMGDRIRILGQREDIARLFAAADAFYLASREDPFPSVVLEALGCGVPVVGHEGCGGCDELVRKHGILIPQNDPDAAGPALLAALRGMDAEAAALRRAEIRERFDFPSYVFYLLSRAKPDLSAVSVVVPNYNYERYLEERLSSVFDQSYPVREVIVLDDASPDQSVREVERVTRLAGRSVRLEVNSTNSGSPFPQWRKGVELSRGEYVWIAEADDSADPSFLRKLVDQMRRAGSVIGFTDSRQVDENGSGIGESYTTYMGDFCQGAFDLPFDLPGLEFIARFLAVKNVILNVSGVLMQRQALLEAFEAVGDELFRYEVAGDWRVYVEICKRPGSVVSWLPEPLNVHRRHLGSVTKALKVEKHLQEISDMHRIARSVLPSNSDIILQQNAHYRASRRYLLGEQ